MDEIRIINQPDYQPSVAVAINRRTNFKIENSQLMTQHRYTIGKKDYIVNSVFVPSPKKQTKNVREKPNEKNDKYNMKLLYPTVFIPRFA